MAEDLWWEDPDEVVAYARHFWAGSGPVNPHEIINYFDQPWKRTLDYYEWKTSVEGNE